MESDLFLCRKRRALLLLAVGCAVSVPSWASPAVSGAQARPPILEGALSTLIPERAGAQQEVVSYLRQKAGNVVAPSYPANDLLRWSRARYRTVVAAKQEPQVQARALYTLVLEDALIAAPLLESPDAQQQRRGLRLVDEAVLKVGARLRDRWLCARMFDGYILPWLDVARLKTSDALSSQRLLLNAVGAYRLAGQTEKQVDALQVLVKVAGVQGNPARADWARIKLAEIQAAREQYAEAIENLKAVRSPNLRGSSAWISELEAKQREQKERAQKSGAGAAGAAEP